MSSVPDLFVIYGLSVDGVVRYVGLTTKGPEVRLRAHNHQAKAGSKYPVHRWMRKHGDKVVQVVLEVCNKDNIHTREIHWIAKLGTHVSRGGLNVTLGGEGTLGKVVSEETRRKLSEHRRNNPITITPELRLKLSEAGAKSWDTRSPGWRSNRPVSDKTRVKISGSLKGQNIAGHTRWHTNKGVVKEGCTHCEAAGGSYTPVPTCKEDRCNGSVYSKSMCRKHYNSDYQRRRKII